MIKDYNTYKEDYKIPIVGIPSGEYFEITLSQFNDLNDFKMLTYNINLEIFTFQDDDIDNIEFLVNH